tara:strand:+ start:132554 stop:133543 length:990 start_codon:yes stop_codon:yes gene_type:complete
MIKRKSDVLAVGNAIVDRIFSVSEELLNQKNMDKGVMQLIDSEEAERLSDGVGPGVEISGGSAANTAVGIASLGAQASFIGKVGGDFLGKIFKDSIVESGVSYNTEPVNTKTQTASCTIFVTPDGERTMNTYLGASVELSPKDINPEIIENTKISYLEGYLYDPPEAKEAFHKVCQLTRKYGGYTAFSLSDPFCVDRHKSEFRKLVENHVDILFGNEEEVIALSGSKNFDEALIYVRDKTQIGVLTRGSNGSVILSGDKVYTIRPPIVNAVIDTTGAGDLYAAGFLFGLASDFDLERCGRLGALAAGEIIGQYGARSQKRLNILVERSA